MNETWKPVPIAPGYEVSDCGSVRTYRPQCGRGELLKEPREVQTFPAKNGYQRVNLYIGGKMKPMEVHRIMAIAFLGDQSARFRLVRHLDDDKTNNTIGNLAWGGNKE